VHSLVCSPYNPRGARGDEHETFDHRSITSIHREIRFVVGMAEEGAGGAARAARQEVEAQEASVAAAVVSAVEALQEVGS
jgi:hypothetical protein